MSFDQWLGIYIYIYKYINDLFCIHIKIMYRCNVAMVEHPRQDVSDKFCWWCSQCKTRKSIRGGSFFQKSSLTLKQWLLLLHLWAKNDPVTSVADDIEVSHSSAIDSYQWLREVCSTKLLQNPIQLGGPGKIVQIDESLFRHKPKVLLNNCVIATGYCFLFCFIPQHHRGRATTQEQWVFGMIDASHEPALGYMEIVSRRDASTLLPIIQAHVLPGTIIYSDEWAAYNQVQNLPNITSHHSLHFVDAATGVHTQHTESYWSRVKHKFKRMNGVHLQQMAS